MKELRKKIEAMVDGLPNKEIMDGKYVTKVGTKWVHVKHVCSNKTIKYGLVHFVFYFID